MIMALRASGDCCFLL